MASRPIIVVTLVLVAGLLGAAGTALAVGGGDAPLQNRTITVSGSNQVDVTPDAAVVRVSVTASGSDAGNVSQAVADRAETLREALRDSGVTDEDVRTVGYSVHGERGPREAAADDRYVGRQTFAVTIDDVDRAGALVDAAVAGGADEVHGVSFTLSEAAREEARDRALRNAVDDAQGEATVLAGATGLEVTGVQAVSTTGTQVHPFRAEAVMVNADGAGTQIDSRDVTVTATVQVVFGAEPA